MGGYFFQPRAISHNHDGFIAAADWFRRIHEAAANDDDKEKTAEGSAENDDDKEETAEGGEQSADTRTTLPALDPDHAPVQHLNRLSRASYMTHLGTCLKWHGDGDWRWCDGHAELCESPLPSEEFAASLTAILQLADHTITAAIYS